MKKLLLISVPLLCLSLMSLFNSCSTGGVPPPNNTPMIDTLFNTGYAITNKGKLLKTINGGLDWEDVNIIGGCWPNYLNFISEDTGFVAEYGIGANANWRIYSNQESYYTVAGGIGFSTYLPAFVSWYDRRIYDVEFLSLNLAYLLIGHDDNSNNHFETYLYKSSSVNQNLIAVNEVPLEMRTIQFLNNDIGFGIGGDTLYKTIDGGMSFQQISTLNSGYGMISFVSEDVGYGFEDGWIIKTINGGISWFQVSQINPTDMKFFSEFVGYAFFNNDDIYKTIDGGQTWNMINTRTFADGEWIVLFDFIE
jgi:photosystem II stability/assembly factor-like uncharacterized protein